VKRRPDLELGFRPRLRDDDGYLRVLSVGAFAPFAADGGRTVARLVREDGAVTEIALLDGEPCGFSVVSFDRAKRAFPGIPEPIVAHLSAIATDALLRRRGIGARILARAEEAAEQRGAVCMSLATAVDNLPARRLFAAAGYQVIAAAQGFYRRDQGAVLMWKALGGLRGGAPDV
jgi:ribosomal protein S18 acetylase RimI-like enzyme